MSEHDEQVRLFNWAANNEDRYPELALMYANPLGGKRPPRTAAKMKAEGAKAGVPDITLPVPRGDYHGLYIEMKYDRNKPTRRQKWWLDQLSRQEYFVGVCYGWLEAKDLLLSYLAYPPD